MGPTSTARAQYCKSFSPGDDVEFQCRKEAGHVEDGDEEHSTLGFGADLTWTDADVREAVVHEYFRRVESGEISEADVASLERMAKAIFGH